MRPSFQKCLVYERPPFRGGKVPLGVLRGVPGVMFEQGNTRKLKPAGSIRKAEGEGEGKGGSADGKSHVNLSQLNEGGQLFVSVRGEQVEVWGFLGRREPETKVPVLINSRLALVKGGEIPCVK